MEILTNLNIQKEDLARTLTPQKGRSKDNEKEIDRIENMDEEELQEVEGYESEEEVEGYISGIIYAIRVIEGKEDTP